MSGRGRRAWLALGSNLGDRQQAIADACSGLAALPGLAVLAATQPIETAPLGGKAQPHYLNSMMLVEWQGSPAELLAACQQLERAGGRVRNGHWASRTIDLDIVCVENELCDLPGLTLPHPGLRDRDFWANSIAELDNNG